MGTRANRRAKTMRAVLLLLALSTPVLQVLSSSETQEFHKRRSDTNNYGMRCVGFTGSYGGSFSVSSSSISDYSGSSHTYYSCSNYGSSGDPCSSSSNNFWNNTCPVCCASGSGQSKPITSGTCQSSCSSSRAICTLQSTISGSSVSSSSTGAYSCSGAYCQDMYCDSDHCHCYSSSNSQAGGGLCQSKDFCDAAKALATYLIVLIVIGISIPVCGGLLCIMCCMGIGCFAAKAASDSQQHSAQC